MTEAEWLSTDHLWRLLDFLRDKASQRKLMLFACACFRGLGELLADARARGAVEVGERLADGLADAAEVNAARLAIMTALTDTDAAFVRARAALDASSAESCAFVDLAEARHEAVVLAVYLLPSSGLQYADVIADGCGRGCAALAGYDKRLALRDESAQANLVREVFGNPFRPVAVEAAWLAWNGGTVGRLAEVAYEERELPSGHLSPIRLALVADALEDAGCSDAEILGHLRSAGPHVRGCWAIDLLLMRK